jgi:hypothetical protein
MRCLQSNGKKTSDKENKMPAPLVGVALRAAAGLAAKKAATRAAKKAAPSKAAKAAAKNISKPVPKSNKPVAKITGVKPGGFKKPVGPQANKWTGGRAVNNATATGKTMNTMKPLSATDKMFGSGRTLGGVKTVKANPNTASKMDAARTLAGKERQAAALKKAEEIRKAKAVQRLLEIKSSTKFK